MSSRPSARSLSPGASPADDAALTFLRPFLDDPRITDLLINGEDGLFVDRGAGIERVPSWGAVEDEVRRLAVRLIALGGRHLDDASPCVDVRLTHGVRVHAVLAPVAVRGTSISIRIPRRETLDLAALERTGMLSATQRRGLASLVDRRENVLVSGATGAGKTTLLTALLTEVPAHERIITIEEVCELRPRHPHHVALEARQPNLEGAGGVSLSLLVREALRMRPDRLVVGECRGAEVRELLSALNTGHDGGAGTLHARSLIDVAPRLEALGALAGMDPATTAQQCAAAIDAIVHVERSADGRRIAGWGRPVVQDGRLRIHPREWS
ncbi:TadA family conjugal transfer-associated ATPase [uncultured Microbacterium sp.]|uniref:TadA family conjugal transfer-associated ATPase n=1 Tax=uncultured Microbacterium sp. TaxID=191216 RepID=UPI0025D6563A|nr:TadA family conjugal transfer-associated ATPase [uncultured Microbacterium sp.]